MRTAEFLEVRFNFALALLEEANGELAKLDFPIQVLLIVTSAQGVLDNGGIAYFFENDWPFEPDYSVFINSFQAIGSKDSADALQKAVEMFPFESPHTKASDRIQFISELPQDHPFFELDEVLCGNAHVWSNLVGFINQHERYFPCA